MSFVEEPGKLTSVPKSKGTTIKYSGGVVRASGAKGGIFENLSDVKAKQRFFQAGADFVHVKTPGDKLLYKALMGGSVLALGCVAYGASKLALKW